jgi:hypothetical protein
MDGCVAVVAEQVPDGAEVAEDQCRVTPVVRLREQRQGVQVLAAGVGVRTGAVVCAAQVRHRDGLAATVGELPEQRDDLSIALDRLGRPPGIGVRVRQSGQQLGLGLPVAHAPRRRDRRPVGGDPVRGVPASWGDGYGRYWQSRACAVY